MSINRKQVLGSARFKAEVQPNENAKGWIMLTINWKCKACGVQWEGIDAPLACLVCGSLEGFDSVESASLQQQSTMIMEGIEDVCNPDTFLVLISKQMMKILCDQAGVEVEFKKDDRVLEVAKRNMT